MPSHIKTILPVGMSPVNLDRLDPYACYRLVGALIHHCIKVSAEAAYPTGSKYARALRAVQTRGARIRFAQSNTLIGLWCSLSGYDEERISQAIINANLREGDLL